jgi:hypothetical protein
MNRQLPARPNFRQLQHQAKDLLKELRSGAEDALSRFREHHPRFADRTKPSLSDAQLVTAREYGFASWPQLKRHVDGLETFERRVARLREGFAGGDHETRKRLLQPAHAKNRFENYDPNASSISEADARLLIANEEGYALWSKYESYLHLDPAVRDVIAAARTGESNRLKKLLQADRSAANPHWVRGLRFQSRSRTIPSRFSVFRTRCFVGQTSVAMSMKSPGSWLTRVPMWRSSVVIHSPRGRELRRDPGR